MKKVIAWFRKTFFQKKVVVDKKLQQKAEIIKQLRQLSLLLSNIEKSLPNRRARKQFRRSLIKEDRVAGDLIQNLINQYDK